MTSHTVRHAVLDELAVCQQLDRDLDPDQRRPTTEEIIGEAQRRLHIPREISERSIRTALGPDSKLAPSVRDQFLDRVLTPTAAGDHTFR